MNVSITVCTLRQIIRLTRSRRLKLAGHVACNICRKTED